MNAQFFALAFAAALNPRLPAHLIAGKYPTVTQAAVVFVIIDFLMIIIPFAFLELRREATKARLKRTQDWLLSHAFAAHGSHRRGPGRLPDHQRARADRRHDRLKGRERSRWR
jgi:hypothetical protein